MSSDSQELTKAIEGLRCYLSYPRHFEDIKSRLSTEHFDTILKIIIIANEAGKMASTDVKDATDTVGIQECIKKARAQYDQKIILTDKSNSIPLIKFISFEDLEILLNIMNNHLAKRKCTCTKDDNCTCECLDCQNEENDNPKK